MTKYGLIAHLYKYKDYPYVNQQWIETFKLLAPNFPFFKIKDASLNYSQFLEKTFNAIIFESADLFFLYPENLTAGRKNNNIFVNWFSDDDWEFFCFSRYFGQFYHLSITTHEESRKYYQKYGMKVKKVPWGVNLSIFKPDFNTKKIYDVIFIGSPVNQDRVNKIRELKKRGINIKIWGRGWEKYEDLRDIYGGFPTSSEMVKKMNQSKITLNFRYNSEMDKLILKGRTFEIAACNTLQITEKNIPGMVWDDISNYFEDKKDIVMFSGIKDLFSKINFYLKNEKERNEIIKNSIKKTQNQYDIKLIFEEIFKEAQNYKNQLFIEKYNTNAKVYLFYYDKSKKYNNVVRAVNNQLKVKLILVVKNKEELGYFKKNLNCEVILVNDLFERIKSQNENSYLSFISSKELWDPYKLYFQAFSLDFDKEESILINIASFESGILPKKLPFFNLNFRAFEKDEEWYPLLIPSSFMINVTKNYQLLNSIFESSDLLNSLINLLRKSYKHRYILFFKELISVDYLFYNRIIKRKIKSLPLGCFTYTLKSILKDRKFFPLLFNLRFYYFLIKERVIILGLFKKYFKKYLSKFSYKFLKA